MRLKHEEKTKKGPFWVQPKLASQCCHYDSIKAEVPLNSRDEKLTRKAIKTKLLKLLYYEQNPSSQVQCNISALKMG
jgi:hypothetical protein